jgi:hypothetical protein
VEDGAHGRRELLIAGCALIQASPHVLGLALAFDAAQFIVATKRAGFAIRPAQSLKIIEAIIVCFELSRYVYQVHLSTS